MGVKWYHIRGCSMYLQKFSILNGVEPFYLCPEFYFHRMKSMVSTTEIQPRKFNRGKLHATLVTRGRYSEASFRT